jgi:hypothetical protein
MDPIAQDRRWDTAMEVAVLAVALVGLSAPQTREAASVALRYLIGIPGRTTVEGQRGGCVITNVPLVEFSSTYLSYPPDVSRCRTRRHPTAGHLS